MRVDIWSDVICPWCFIGKRRFETAVADFEHGREIEVVWRSFELDPHAPAVREGPSTARMAQKYGMTIDQARAAQQRVTDLAEGEGLRYRLEDTRPGNTFDAHRIIHLAGEHGLQDPMKERLLTAYFSEGQAIGDHGVLVQQASAVGLDATEVQEVLDGEAFARDVRADEAEAVEREISGVPFFLVDGRFGIPGAQEVDTILAVLRRAWSKSETRL
jgi:predicted DsbA family dithiol-disulfide isomerase